MLLESNVFSHVCPIPVPHHSWLNILRHVQMCPTWIPFYTPHRLVMLKFVLYHPARTSMDSDLGVNISYEEIVDQSDTAEKYYTIGRSELH